MSRSCPPSSCRWRVCCCRRLTQLGRSQDFLSRLSESGGVAELHISMFARKNFRLELSPRALASLGRLGLGIALEVNLHLARAKSASSQN